MLAVVSLPQFAFAHFGAGVKSSVIFLEKRKPNVPASDDEAIFMAMAENIGYDATGRTTYQIEVLNETWEKERSERQRCDLFDWQAQFDWVPGEGKKPGHWSERHRHVIPGTGFLGQYAVFKKDPDSFFV